MASESSPLLVATRSAHKLREIRGILGNARRPLLSLTDLGLAPTPEEDRVESFDTFAENAEAKARFFARATGCAVLADDSGLAVDALGGEPGVRSRRFAGHQHAGDEQDRANNEHLLAKLAGVEPAKRTARYLCAVAYVQGDRPAALALGTVTGLVLDAPRGTAGFGYDPLFWLPELGCTFAELEPATKNRISHRARALRAIRSAI